MWRPDKRQWVAIGATFLVSLWCFFWAVQRLWSLAEYLVLGFGSLTAGALLIWWLETRKPEEGA